MNVVPGPGRRRRVARRRLAAAARRPAAAPGGARRLRAARRRRGLRGRRRPGHRDVRLRHRKLPAGRRRHRSGQRLRRGGQAAACAASSASTPRRARPRSAILADDSADSRARRRRPDLAGRARPAGRLPAGQSEQRALLDAVEAEVVRQVAGHPAPRARRGRADRAERRRARRRHRRRACRWSTPGPPSTSRCRPATPAAVAARVRNAGAIFVGRLRAGDPRRLPGRLQPRAADRRHRPAHQRLVGLLVPAGSTS